MHYSYPSRPIHHSSRSVKLFLFLFFFLPFIPRPTIEGWGKNIAPIYLVTTVVLLFICFLIKQYLKFVVGRLFTSVIVLIWALILYGIRVYMQEETTEIQYFISRAFLYGLVFGIASWFVAEKLTVEKACRPIFFGFLFLSVFVIYVGITGEDLFGDVRPARVYGLELPFYKTVAIPRSFGEYGIFASVSWAYFLVFRSKFKKIKKIIFLIILLLSIFISQSRSTYLAIIFMTSAYFILKFRKTRFIIVVLAVTAFSTPILLEQITEIKQKPIVLDAMMGEGIIEENVSLRYITFSVAWSFLRDNPSEALTGISHARWNSFFYNLEFREIALHNHFLANIVFLGILGGILHLIVLFVSFISISLQCLSRNSFYKDNLMLFLTGLGTVICLHFFEGFFSMIVTFITALLLSKYHLFTKNKQELPMRNRY